MTCLCEVSLISLAFQELKMSPGKNAKADKKEVPFVNDAFGLEWRIEEIVKTLNLNLDEDPRLVFVGPGSIHYGTAWNNLFPEAK